jgi:hypothetical protein
MNVSKMHTEIGHMFLKVSWRCLAGYSSKLGRSAVYSTGRCVYGTSVLSFSVDSKQMRSPEVELEYSE